MGILRRTKFEFSSLSRSELHEDSNHEGSWDWVFVFSALLCSVPRQGPYHALFDYPAPLSYHAAVQLVLRTVGIKHIR
jgi:hypothetical protein